MSILGDVRRGGRLRAREPDPEVAAGGLRAGRLRASACSSRPSSAGCCSPSTSPSSPPWSTWSSSMPATMTGMTRNRKRSPCTATTTSSATSRPGRRAGVDLDIAAILYTSGQHRAAQGRRAEPPQPDRRRRERQPLPRQHRRRRDPGGAAVQLRRRPEPADHRPQRRCPRGADELPLPRRRGPALRAARRHGSHVRAAAVDPAGRARLAPGRRPSTLRYFANTGGRMPRATLDQAARHLPAGTARS